MLVYKVFILLQSGKRLGFHYLFSVTQPPEPTAQAIGELVIVCFFLYNTDRMI